MAEEQLNQDERTLPATPARLQRLREQGQVPRSQELTTAGVLLGAAMTFWVLGPGMIEALAALLKSSLTEVPHHLVASDDLLRRTLMALFAGVEIIAPLLVVVLIAAFVSPLLLGGWVFSADPLRFKWEKLDPIKGVKRRIFSSRGLLEMTKALFKFTVIAAATGAVLYYYLGDTLMLSRGAVRGAVAAAGSTTLGLFAILCVAMLLIAALDIPLQRFNFGREHRMSHAEVKRELRNEEGLPEVRQRIRALQREVSQRRMMEAVPHADVVITNPTHVAVALTYKEGAGAPTLVASGAEIVAAQIRRIAEEKGIPVISSPPLARSIFYHTRLDEEIPLGLYAAVAAVLGYAYRLGGKPGFDDAPAPTAQLPIPKELQVAAER